MGRERVAAPESRGKVSTAVKPAPQRGHSLEPDVRGKFEPLFGADLSGIRVHPQSDLADRHNARAVSLGRDLHFAGGEYSPRSSEGSSVLAHEICHSLQQTRGGSATAGTTTLESEAGSAAAEVSSGQKVSSPFSSASPSTPLFLKKGESAVKRKPGVKTADVAKTVKKRLKKDSRDDEGEAAESLDALRPDVRQETAKMLKEQVSPEQRTKLNLDAPEKRPPPPARDMPEPDPVKPVSTEASKPASKGTAKRVSAEASKQVSKGPDKKIDAESGKPLTKEAGEALNPASPPPTAPAPSTPTQKAAPAPGVEPPKAAATEAPASAGGAEAPAAEPAPPPGPEANPAFQALTGGVTKRSTDLKKHQPAADAAAAAQTAAVSPPNERESQAQANQTDAMAAEETSPFDKAAFKAALLAKVEAITPKNLEEADEFKDSGKAGELKEHVSGEVTSSKDAAAGQLPETTAAPPNTEAVPKRDATTLVPEEAGPAPSPPGTAAAAPPPRSDAEVSLDAGPKQIDGEMEQAGVTEEQLAKSNEPTFQGALEARQEVKTDATTSPAQFRAEESASLDATKQEAAVQVAGDLQTMHGKRSGGLGNAAQKQNDTKTSDEVERARISGEINSIFTSTKKAVEDRLAKLETDSGEAFDKGAETARNNFETYCDDRMRAYKNERYSGWTGGAKWAKDKLFGMPDEVNDFYEEGKARYIQEMDGVIDNVATIVETGLTEAKGLIDTGKLKIKEYVDALPANLKKFGEEAQKGLETQFEELEGSINEKRDALVDTLAQRYVDSMNKVNERIEAMKEANKGLVDKAIGAIKGVIDAIIAIKNMFLNVLARVAQCIGDILSDPIGFVGNFFSAIGRGLMQFVKNIGKHLLNGLMGWLFGALGEAGIQMPETFDMKGILSLVLQVLGLTYQNIRMRAVKLLGEKVVGALETTAEVFITLIKEGPAGLWNWIKDQFGALKETVMEGIQMLVAEKIITAGIQWLLGMLNPAGAFIKCCILLKDVVMFFIERGKQLIDFVMAVIDSIAAVASGKIDQAANWIEGAMGKAVPLIISFLASLLGLGGISGRIKKIIEKIQKPINQIIDGIIKAAAKAVKSIGKALSGGGKKKDEKKELPKDDGEGSDIKAVARARVLDELSSPHSLEQARKTVAKIETDLKKEKLQKLVIGDKPDKDGWPILAEASMQKRIGSIVYEEGASTVMETKLDWASEDDEASKKLEGRSVAYDAGATRIDPTDPKNKYKIKGEAFLNQKTAIPGGSFAPAEMASQPKLVSTIINTKNSGADGGGNASHAEVLFSKIAGDPVAKKDKPAWKNFHSMDIRMNNSPCNLCCGFLTTLMAKASTANPAINKTTCKLTYTTLYSRGPEDHKHTSADKRKELEGYFAVSGPTKDEGKVTAE